MVEFRVWLLVVLVLGAACTDELSLARSFVALHVTEDGELYVQSLGMIGRLTR